MSDLTRTATAQTTHPSQSPLPSGLLQRQCACGQHTATGEECAECAKKKSGLQRKLTVGASNDPLEREAERVANTIVNSGPAIQPVTTLAARSLVQRQPDDAQKPREQPTTFPVEEKPKHGQEREDEEKEKLKTGALKAAGELAKLLWDGFSTSQIGKQILAQNERDWKPVIKFFEDFAANWAGKVILGAAAGGAATGAFLGASSARDANVLPDPAVDSSAKLLVPKDEKFFALELNWDFISSPTGVTIKTPWLDLPKIGGGPKSDAAATLPPAPKLINPVQRIPRICTPADPRGDNGEANARSAQIYTWLLWRQQQDAEKMNELLRKYAQPIQAPGEIWRPGQPYSFRGSQPSVIKPLFKRADDAPEVIDPQAIEAGLQSSARPLDPAVRAEMEMRFGYDFSHVRVHTDGQAAASARDVNANAYTVGHNVVFGAGRFAPETHEGRRLIAHELTHVVQQTGAYRIHNDQITEKLGLSPVTPRSAGIGLAHISGGSAIKAAREPSSDDSQSPEGNGSNFTPAQKARLAQARQNLKPDPPSIVGVLVAEDGRSFEFMSGGPGRFYAHIEGKAVKKMNELGIRKAGLLVELEPCQTCDRSVYPYDPGKPNDLGPETPLASSKTGKPLEKHPPMINTSLNRGSELIVVGPESTGIYRGVKSPPSGFIDDAPSKSPISGAPQKTILASTPPTASATAPSAERPTTQEPLAPIDTSAKTRLQTAPTPAVGNPTASPSEAASRTGARKPPISGESLPLVGAHGQRVFTGRPAYSNPAPNLLTSERMQVRQERGQAMAMAIGMAMAKLDEIGRAVQNKDARTKIGATRREIIDALQKQPGVGAVIEVQFLEPEHRFQDVFWRLTTDANAGRPTFVANEEGRQPQYTFISVEPMRDASPGDKANKTGSQSSPSIEVKTGEEFIAAFMKVRSADLVGADTISIEMYDAIQRGKHIFGFTDVAVGTEIIRLPDSAYASIEAAVGSLAEGTVRKNLERLNRGIDTQQARLTEKLKDWFGGAIKLTGHELDPARAHYAAASNYLNGKKFGPALQSINAGYTQVEEVWAELYEYDYGHRPVAPPIW